MKFPLRLSWDLWRGRFSQPLAGGNRTGLIAHLPAAMLPLLHERPHEVALARDAHTAADSVRTAARTNAPVLWIGGSEPLEHAEVGRVAFALNRKGRNVFLHTDGLRLRQRIHEFRPEPRLFLTVELAGREETHDRAVRRPQAFRRVIEGIRAAKLSGFHVCAHMTVSESSDACDAGELFEYLDRYDVDGYLVSSGAGAVGPPSDGLREKLEEIRPLTRCARWEKFSRLLEASYGHHAAKAPIPATHATRGETEALEESV